MSEWRDISTAPQNGMVFLLYGKLVGQAVTDAHQRGPIRACGYWDEIDEAWALTDTTWAGPFIEPTHWMPLPEPPK